MTTVRVHLDDAAGTVPVGTARITRARGIDTSELTYDDSFLAGAGWDISPDLPVRTGSSVTEGLPGALEDSAPDTWGRNLITRRLAAEARDGGHVAPTPTEADYLLGVNDFTRQGALRFCGEDGDAFLAASDEVPGLVDLDALYGAARTVDDGEELDSAVATLLAAGSGSLGGARPKASVSDGGTLCIAKFPRSDDPWDVMRWEATALDLAAECGLRTPAHRLIEVADVPVLLVERFDRAGDHRIPYLSGRSLIGARDGTTGDYLELVDALTAHGSDVSTDLDELWRRIAFSVALNNVDDHMRNHAALRTPGGWRLSPVFDVNPDARANAPSASSIAGATAPAARLDALIATVDRFGLTATEAQQRWNATRDAVSSWRTVASRHGIPDREQHTFAATLDRWAEIA